MLGFYKNIVNSVMYIHKKKGLSYSSYNSPFFPCIFCELNSNFYKMIFEFRVHLF